MKRILEFVGPRRTDFLLALFCGVFLFLLEKKLPIARSDWVVFDKFTQLTPSLRPLDPSLAIVAIDDYSIDLLDKSNWSWPWPRGAYADMIAYLKMAGAREIWIDMVLYTKDSDSLQDDELRAVAMAAQNVHFGQGKDSAGSVSIFKPTFDVSLPESDNANPVIHYDNGGERLLAWPRPFSELIRPPASCVTSAAFVVSEGHKLLKILPPDDRTDSEKVARLWKNVNYPLQSDPFRDKIVYIGATAQSTNDIKHFPVGGNEPGVMIHVVTRSNKLQNGFFHESPIWLRGLLAVACCLLVSELFIRSENFYQYTAWVLVMVAVMGAVSFGLFIDRIWFGPMLYILSIATTFTVVTSTNYLREGKRRKVTQELFGKFVSSKVVDRLVARPDQLKLGGEKAELSVLFSDLSGFTTLSETMTSDVLLTLLNSYLNEMSELIYEREGTLDKYIGDAIMAFWGAPDYSPDHAWQACYAALACQKRLAELSPKWEETYGVKLTARIGINTDEMTVGLVGSNRLHNYSVIGDGVNLASRLEGANKPFGTSIMIAQRTLDLAQGKVEVRPIALLQVKGKTKPVKVYELLARAGELNESERGVQQAFTQAFEAFLKREWNTAEEHLQEVFSHQPEDMLATLYQKKIREYKISPPGPDWIGILKLDDK